MFSKATASMKLPTNTRLHLQFPYYPKSFNKLNRERKEHVRAYTLRKERA